MLNFEKFDLYQRPNMRIGKIAISAEYIFIFMEFLNESMEKIFSRLKKCLYILYICLYILVKKVYTFFYQYGMIL